MGKPKKAQWETGSVEQYVEEFMRDINDKGALPISVRSLPSDESPNKNMNKTNPLKENGQQVKQQEDDQKQLEQGFNDMGGYLPVMASRRRRLRMALFDTELIIPGMKDTTEGWGAPWSGAGQADRKDQPKQRSWDFFNRKDEAFKEIFKDKTKDQILPGLLDLTREVGDGERI